MVRVTDPEVTAAGGTRARVHLAAAGVRGRSDFTRAADRPM